jgi:dTDP-4-amino-4,6-dideoxygalactose transaminase
MYSKWPLKEIYEQFKRPELDILKSSGYNFDDPFDIVYILEQKVAAFLGSDYGIAVDCCSHGLFLCLKYLNAEGVVKVPRHTYASVPMQIEHAGCRVELTDEKWEDAYQLTPYPIWDAAALWYSGAFKENFSVVSFQTKKPLCVGKGGMILTNDKNAAEQLKLMRHDGRDNVINQSVCDIKSVGYHYYMTPEDAARGIIIFDNLKDIEVFPSWKNYIDLSKYSYFHKYEK